MYNNLINLKQLIMPVALDGENNLFLFKIFTISKIT